MQRVFLSLLLVLGLVGLATGVNAGQDDFKVEEGYVSLFNGKDLTGWKYYKETDLSGKTETADKRFSVVGGAIVANEGKGIKDLYTVKEIPGNFHLKMEFRAGPKADSGVYIRGPQLQVRDYIRRGEQKQLTKFKNDDWNELDITVKEGVVVTKVNGKTLTEKDSMEVKFANGKPEVTVNGKPVPVKSVDISVKTIANCLCNGQVLDANFNAGAKGGIGLQAETGKFEFRRVRVKAMK